ncbi:MAG: prolipoprotein diacylglyceryl transferase family protein [Chitinophagaceae bacterium]
MYPNLYYIFKDWFSVQWEGLKFLNTFGLMVAIAFMVAAIVLTLELKRKEKQGLLAPKEEIITVGKPAGLMELLTNFLAGFLFGFKLFGLFFSKAPEVNPQDYIFSGQGNWLGGLALGIFLAALKWYEKNKQKLKSPENRTVRIWPHDRVGDIVIIALIFGILGAKLFDAFENWSSFIADPVGTLFSASGLTFYGGLIMAAVAVCWYAHKRGIKLIHLVDSAGPALMIAYAVGRIGCQVAGDGDWGIYNSAYITDSTGKVVEAKAGEYQQQLQHYAMYFEKGNVLDEGKIINNTSRKSDSLAVVPSAYFKAPSFLPVWMVAYNYPGNVNKDGAIVLPGNTEEHNRVLPIPVFPTPFYEIVISFLLFLFLWAIRRRIKTAGVMFGTYLMLNGFERFFIEKIRVNTTYDKLPFNPTQAEIISLALFITGLLLIYIKKSKASN